MIDKSGHPIPGHLELPSKIAAGIKVLAKGDPVPLELLVCSKLIQKELTTLGIISIALLNKTVSVAPDVMRKLRDLLDREIERQDYERMETKQRLTITERTEKIPVVIRSRAVELDCQSKVNQLVNSMPNYVLLRTSYLERQQLISTQPTQGVSVELKSNMAKEVQFVEAKKKYEPCTDCSSGDETFSRESTQDCYRAAELAEESVSVEPDQDDLSKSRCQDDRGTELFPGRRET